MDKPRGWPWPAVPPPPAGGPRPASFASLRPRRSAPGARRAPPCSSCPPAVVHARERSARSTPGTRKGARERGGTNLDHPPAQHRRFAVSGVVGVLLLLERLDEVLFDRPESSACAHANVSRANGVRAEAEKTSEAAPRSAGAAPQYHRPRRPGWLPSTRVLPAPAAGRGCPRARRSSSARTAGRTGWHGRTSSSSVLPTSPAAAAAGPAAHRGTEGVRAGAARSRLRVAGREGRTGHARRRPRLPPSSRWR